MYVAGGMDAGSDDLQGCNVHPNTSASVAGGMYTRMRVPLLVAIMCSGRYVLQITVF
jgi:hypothetical protein